MRYDSFNSFQIDILKEITNISAGNAISRLSDFINANIHMTVPHVEIVELKEIFSSLGNPEEEMYAVFSCFSGEIEGNTFFLFPKDSVKQLKEICNGFTHHNSLLTQIGHIISDSFVHSLCEFTKLSIVKEPPQLANDMLGAILQQGILSYGHLSDQAIFVTNSFVLDNEKINGHFVFFPSPTHLKTLFSKLGVPYDER